MKIIRTPAELYAHAIAVEREAAARYAEFAERMEDTGRQDLARVFAMLAGLEAEHLEALERRAAGIALPEIRAGEYAWLDAGAPETQAREMGAEGREHVDLIARMLGETPEATLDQTVIFET